MQNDEQNTRPSKAYATAALYQQAIDNMKNGKQKSGPRKAPRKADDGKFTVIEDVFTDKDNENDDDEDDEDYVNNEDANLPALIPSTRRTSRVMAREIKNARWNNLLTQIGNRITTEEQLGRVPFQDGCNGKTGVKKMPSGIWRAQIYFDNVQRTELYKNKWEASALYRSARFHREWHELPPIPDAEPATEDHTTGVAPASGLTTPSASPPVTVKLEGVVAAGSGKMGTTEFLTTSDEIQNAKRTTRLVIQDLRGIIAEPIDKEIPVMDAKHKAVIETVIKRLEELWSIDIA